MESEWLQVAVVAKMLNVTKKRVYQMIEERKLKAIRLGPRIMRVKRESVLNLIARLEALHEETLGLEVEERLKMESESFAPQKTLPAKPEDGKGQQPLPMRRSIRDLLP